MKSCKHDEILTKLGRNPLSGINKFVLHPDDVDFHHEVISSNEAGFIPYKVGFG